MKSTKSFTLALILIANSPAIASGGLEYWYSRVIYSQDNRFVLVTISDNPLEEELTHISDPVEQANTRTIRAKYPQSGLYRNDGSTTPLWTDGGGWYGEPIIAPDGEHVIFEGKWTRDEDGYEIRAVEFTRNGKIVRSYCDTDVVPQWRLKAILNGFSPPTCAGTSFDAKQMTYTIRTNQGEEFVFNVTTGNVVTIRSPFRMYFVLAAIATVAIIALPIRSWWMKNQL